MITNKEFISKVRHCQALKGKTVQDVVKMNEYNDELSALINEQVSLRKAYIEAAGGKAKIHIVDTLIEKEIMDATTMKELYILALNKELNAPAAYRRYIVQLCNKAYRNVVRDFVLKEHPELKECFYGKQQ